MLAAIYARKSTEQNGVADHEKSATRQTANASLRPGHWGKEASLVQELNHNGSRSKHVSSQSVRVPEEACASCLASDGRVASRGRKRGVLMRTANMKSRYLFTTFLPFFVLVFSTTAWAQVEVEPDQRYLLLAAERTGTMEEELGQAAALGFRIISGSPTSGNKMAILLERVATPPDTYQY